MQPLLLLVLLPALAAPVPRSQRLSRILALEEMRSLEGGELERYLSDTDAGVRRRAALAAGRIGDKALVPPLINGMNDAVPEVRQMMAWALGRMLDRAAVPRLSAALEDPDAVVRARVAEALGRIGDRSAAPSVARMVLRALPRGARQVTVRGDDPGNPLDPWLELRLGLMALATLGDRQAAESVLLLDGKPRFDWWAAAYAAAVLRLPSLRPAYLAAVRSSDPTSRIFGARGLGELRDPTTVDALAQLLSDRDESVVTSALRAIGEIGDARSANVALSALGSPALAVKQEALATLGRLPLDRSQVDQVVAYVGHADPALRSAALKVIAHADMEQLALLLSGTDPDPEWLVRAALVRAVGDVGGDLALSLVFAGLKDPDTRVLPAALETLSRLRGTAARDVLVSHLRHSDPAVRVAAARELVSLDGAVRWADLLDCYRLGADDADPESRLALVAVFEKLSGESASQILREISERDVAPAVRERAGMAQRARGETVTAAGRRRARAATDCRLAVSPFAPLPGLKLFTPRVFLRTKHGPIEVHLNIVEAPGASGAFAALVRRGYFNDLPFDGVVPGLAVTGGAPRGDGRGGPGYVLPSEIGTRPFGRGAVAVPTADSATDVVGGRFLLTLIPSPELEGRATLVGWVADGFDVLLRIRPGDVIERADLWDGRP